jgi:hypothetical protein
MKLPTLAAVTFLALAATSHATPPRYAVQSLPGNTLLNNNGLAPIPQELLRPDIDVFAVNDAGEFTGRVTHIGSNQTIPRETTYNFIYLPGDAYGLPAGINTIPAGGSYSGFNYLNNSGVAAGNDYESPMVWGLQAARGLPAGLTYPPTSYWAFVQGINDWDQVVGLDYLHLKPGGGPTAFVWSPLPASVNGFAPGITYLDSLPVTYNLSSFNNNGTIIGAGFVYQARAVPGLSAGLHTFSFTPVDVNDLSNIVGTSAGNAVLWTPADGLLDLNTLIPPDSGWHLSSASQINNRGDIIGSGTFNGQPASFFLTIPEPTLLPALALPALLPRRPR